MWTDAPMWNPPGAGSLLFAREFTAVMRVAIHPNDSGRLYMGSVAADSPVIFLGQSQLVKAYNAGYFSNSIRCLTILGIGWILLSTLSEVSDEA